MILAFSEAELASGRSSFKPLPPTTRCLAPRTVILREITEWDYNLSAVRGWELEKTRSPRTTSARVPTALNRRRLKPAYPSWRLTRALPANFDAFGSRKEDQKSAVPEMMIHRPRTGPA